MKSAALAGGISPCLRCNANMQSLRAVRKSEIRNSTLQQFRLRCRECDARPQSVKFPDGLGVYGASGAVGRWFTAQSSLTTACRMRYVAHNPVCHGSRSMAGRGAYNEFAFSASNTSFSLIFAQTSKLLLTHMGISLIPSSLCLLDQNPGIISLDAGRPPAGATMSDGQPANGPRHPKLVIDDAINANRGRALYCFILSGILVTVGLFVTIYGVINGKEFTAAVGAFVNVCFWPALNYATKYVKREQMLRLFEIPLSRAGTADSASEMIRDLFEKLFSDGI